MRLLAIDSSINNIGWAVLETDADIEHGDGLLGSGTIRTKRKYDPNRVFEIMEMISNLFKLNNQDFPEKPPMLDIDPEIGRYKGQLGHVASAGDFRKNYSDRLIQLAILEKPEGFTYGKHISQYTGKAMTKKSIGQNNFAVGIIAAAVALRCDQIEFVSAQVWKGRASKTITRLIVNDTFGLKLEQVNNDESDAIAIGCWWIRNMKLEQKIREQESRK